MESVSSDLIDQLHAALGKVELALAVIDESIGWVNERGEVEWCNGAFDRLVGRAHIYVLGVKYSELLPLWQQGRPVPTQMHPLNKALTGQVSTGEVYEFTQANVKRILEITSIRTQFGSGPIGAVFMIRDITERKRMDLALTQRTSQLEATNKELEAFSYSVSHDLRAPLRAIAGFAAILGEEHASQLDADGQHCLNIIRSSVKQMAQLIEDLLAFSRLGRQPLTLALIEMGDLARIVVEELQLLTPHRKIQVTIHPIPPSQGDRAMIHQVFVNLISNAMKFTRFREPAVIEIGVQGDEHGEQVYYVKDNGVGFDMRYVDKLFEVFQRLHDVEQFEGTGVGLAIVQRVIQRHGGRVFAQGKVNEGATFYFTLPKGGTQGGS